MVGSRACSGRPSRMPGDVDYLGQQGFWICLIVAIISLGLVAISAFEMPNPTARAVTLVAGAVVCFVYLAGGMGVREASWPAALTVFILYVADQLTAGRTPGMLSVIIGAVLLSNVRATILASRWKTSDEDEDRPTRFNETFRDKLVDQVPPKAWPILKYPFYFLGVLALGILLATFALRLLHPPSANPQNDNAIPSVTVTVSPSDSQ